MKWAHLARRWDGSKMDRNGRFKSLKESWSAEDTIRSQIIQGLTGHGRNIGLDPKNRDEPPKSFTQVSDRV